MKQMQTTKYNEHNNKKYTYLQSKYTQYIQTLVIVCYTVKTDNVTVINL